MAPQVSREALGSRVGGPPGLFGRSGFPGGGGPEVTKDMEKGARCLEIAFEVSETFRGFFNTYINLCLYLIRYL